MVWSDGVGDGEREVVGVREGLWGGKTGRGKEVGGDVESGLGVCVYIWMN